MPCTIRELKSRPSNGVALPGAARVGRVAVDVEAVAAIVATTDAAGAMGRSRERHAGHQGQGKRGEYDRMDGI